MSGRHGFKRVIDRQDLAAGQVLFSVHFPGECKDVPVIETYVFVGKNLLSNVAGNAWYFQEAESYFERGVFPDLPQSEWTSVLRINEDSAPVMFDMRELADYLRGLERISCEEDFSGGA